MVYRLYSFIYVALRELLIVDEIIIQNIKNNDIQSLIKDTQINEYLITERKEEREREREMTRLHRFIQIIKNLIGSEQSKGLAAALSLLCRQSLLKAAQVAR